MDVFLHQKHKFFLHCAQRRLISLPKHSSFPRRKLKYNILLVFTAKTYFPVLNSVIIHFEFLLLLLLLFLSKFSSLCRNDHHTWSTSNWCVRSSTCHGWRGPERSLNSPLRSCYSSDKMFILKSLWSLFYAASVLSVFFFCIHRGLMKHFWLLMLELWILFL